MVELLRRRKREILPFESITYRDFSDMIDKKIVVIDQAMYQDHYYGTDTETIAILLGMPVITSQEVNFSDTFILINKDKFAGVSRKKQEIMMQTVAIHEKVECWERLCACDDICTSVGDGKPHQIALLHEYFFINKYGFAREYLDMLIHCANVMEQSIASHFIEENVAAYQEVVVNTWFPDSCYSTNKLADLRSRSF